MKSSQGQGHGSGWADFALEPRLLAGLSALDFTSPT